MKTIAMVIAQHRKKQEPKPTGTAPLQPTAEREPDSKNRVTLFVVRLREAICIHQRRADYLFEP